MNLRLPLCALLLAPSAALAGACPDPDTDMPGYIFCEGQKRLERERGRGERGEPRGRFLDGVKEAVDLAGGASVAGRCGRTVSVDFGVALGRGRALTVKKGAGTLTDEESAVTGEVEGVAFRFEVGRRGLDGSAGGLPMHLDFDGERVTGRVQGLTVDLAVRGRALVGAIGGEEADLEVSGVDLSTCGGEGGALARKVVAVAVIAATAKK